MRWIRISEIPVFFEIAWTSEVDALILTKGIKMAGEATDLATDAEKIATKGTGNVQTGGRNNLSVDEYFRQEAEASKMYENDKARNDTRENSLRHTTINYEIKKK